MTENEGQKNRLETAQGCAIIDEIKREGHEMGDILPSLVESSKYVLVGENHSIVYDLLKQNITAMLGKLKDMGLTHLAVEVSSDAQVLIDDVDPTENDALSRLRRSFKEKGLFGFHDSNFEMIIRALELGIKVVAIDKPRWGVSDENTMNAMYQNMRDRHMQEILNKTIPEDSHVLIYIGSRHVHKRCVESDRTSSDIDSYSKVRRLGTLLSEKEGDESVLSIDTAYPGHDMSGLIIPDGRSYSSPRVDQPKQVWVVPNSGIFEGDSRVVASDLRILLI